MKFTTGLVAFAILLVLASSSVDAAARRVRISARDQCAFYKQKCATHDWAKLEAADANTLHTVTFAVKLADNAAAACDSLLNQISTPYTASYGKHLSLEQVDNLFSDRSAVKKVEDFLASRGLAYTTSGDFVSVTAAVSRLESLLSAKFFRFHSALAAKKIITRTASYTIPSEIEDVVEFVTNTVTFPSVKTVIRSYASSEASGSVTPTLISQVYKITSNTVTNPNATQALFEALGQDYSPTDLQQFQKTYNIPNNPVSKVIGNNDPTQCTSNPNNCGEANLDVEYIMAVAQNAKTTYWVIDPNSQDPFYDWIIALARTQNPPLVHSISYGSIATEDPKNDMTRFNIETCKLGLRGVTIVVSSGDDGVANFEARNDPSQCGFNPSFPATSPYVTAVGATQGPESGKTEISCSSSTGGVITSGGGFSYFFPQPAYQAKAVANYMATAPGLPPSNQYNTKGRGYPDVAIMGYNYNVVIGGQNYLESGTSASAPVFAGMVTLANNARLAAGKSALGFLNPTLYTLATTKPTVFNDITVGENNCCAGYPGQFICCQYGFNATQGWDPLTGLGSINFAAFRAALLGL